MARRSPSRSTGTTSATPSTNGNGVATLGNVSLAGINAGSYPTGVGASFAGDGSHDPSSGSGSLTVGKADQAITVNTHAPASAVFNTSFGVAATAAPGRRGVVLERGRVLERGGLVHDHEWGGRVLGAVRPGRERRLQRGAAGASR